MLNEDNIKTIAALADKLDEISNAEMYEITSKLADVFVMQSSDIAIYTKPIQTREDGTRELNMTFGWRVEGVDKESLPTEEERLILAHRLVSGAVLILRGKWNEPKHS